MKTTLERTLAKALTEIVIRLDLSDDDVIRPQVTMEVLEPVIALLRRLPGQDRQALADLISQFAHQETDSERQLTVTEAPETLGLLPSGSCLQPLAVVLVDEPPRCEECMLRPPPLAVVRVVGELQRQRPNMKAWPCFDLDVPAEPS
ncbi:hypothetical protein [Nonomuraea sp. NPDC003201]